MLRPFHVDCLRSRQVERSLFVQSKCIMNFSPLCGNNEDQINFEKRSFDRIDASPFDFAMPRALLSLERLSRSLRTVDSKPLRDEDDLHNGT